MMMKQECVRSGFTSLCVERLHFHGMTEDGHGEHQPQDLQTQVKMIIAELWCLDCGDERSVPVLEPYTERRSTEPPDSPAASPSLARNMAVTQTTAVRERWTSPHLHKTFCQTVLCSSEASYRRPPGARILQTAVITVLQTAGVWHTRRVIHQKPVRVIVHSTAAELHTHRDAHTHTRAHMHAHTHTHTRAHTDTHTHTHTQTQTHTHIHTHTDRHRHRHRHRHTDTQTHTHTDTHTHTHRHTHTHTHTDTDTHTHTHTHRQTQTQTQTHTHTDTHTHTHTIIS